MTDATKLADELLPCPFCGNTDIRHDHPNRAPRVYCGSCRVSASSPEHWNTRCLPRDGDNYVPWPWSEGDQSALRERDALAAEVERLRQRPHCETCGKTVPEVLCPTCAKWWADNDPQLAAYKAMAEELASEMRKCIDDIGPDFPHGAYGLLTRYQAMKDQTDGPA